MSLLAEVLRVLEHERVPHALIGAAALAVRGVSRSTVDVDLLCVEERMLRRELWAGVETPARTLRVLVGDPEDPLAGSVRFVDGGEIVDVVVGRHVWEREIIEDRPAEIESEVDRLVSRLPADARRLWARLRDEKRP